MEPVFSLQTPSPPHPLPASLPIPQPHIVPHHGGLTHQTYGHNQASSASSHKQLSLGHLLGPRGTHRNSVICLQKTRPGIDLLRPWKWTQGWLGREFMGPGQLGYLPEVEVQPLSGQFPLVLFNFLPNEEGWPEGDSQWQGFFLLSFKTSL